MAGERVKLVVQNRSVLGSAESRRLRRQGLIPGVLYGRSTPVPITVPERDLRAALTGPAGTHAVLDVTVDGGSSHSAILKDFQVSVIRGTLTHIDLQEVRLDQPIQTSVAVHLVGDAIGVREGGVLSQVATEVRVEALPLEIPDHLELDVSPLGIGDSARLSEVRLPVGVTLLDDPETVIASVAVPRVEEPEPTEEEAEEGAEGEAAEEAAEGEAAEAGDGEAAETTEG